MDGYQPPIWRTHARRCLLGLGATVLSGTLLVACGGAATSTAIPATATTVAPVASTAPAASAATTSASASAATSAAPASSAAASAKAVQKVNANTATVAELQAAFEAARISNAAEWAREVEEYRPYPTNDSTFAKLRAELAKYNPGPGVVDQIIAVLTLQ